MCRIIRKSQSLGWCLGGKLKCWELKSRVKKPFWLKRGWWYNDTDGLKTNNRKLKFLIKIALMQDPGMVLLPQSKQLGISAVYLHMMRALGWGRANVSLLSSLRFSLWQLLTVGHREVPHLLQTSTCSSIKWELNNSHVTRSHTGTTYRSSLLLLFPLGERARVCFPSEMLHGMHPIQAWHMEIICLPCLLEATISKDRS